MLLAVSGRARRRFGWGRWCRRAALRSGAAGRGRSDVRLGRARAVILGLGSAHCLRLRALRRVARTRRSLDELIDVLDAAVPVSRSTTRAGFPRHGHMTRRRRRARRSGSAPTAHGIEAGGGARRRLGVRPATRHRRGRPAGRRVPLLRRQAGRAVPRGVDRRGADRMGTHAMKVHRLYMNLGVYRREFEPWVDEVKAREDFTLDRLAPGRFLFGPRKSARRDRWMDPTGAAHRAADAPPDRPVTRGHAGRDRALRSGADPAEVTQVAGGLDEVPDRHRRV